MKVIVPNQLNVAVFIRKDFGKDMIENDFSEIYLNKYLKMRDNPIVQEDYKNYAAYSAAFDAWENCLEEINEKEILLEAAREAIPINAIAFGEWLLKSTYERTLLLNGLRWYDTSKSGNDRYKSYTTEELYQIFIDSKKLNL